MMDKRFSECVSPGHPDKCADYISEYILDRYLMEDPNVRYAVEVMIKGNTVCLAGEVTTSVPHFTSDDYVNFVAEALRDIGYTEEYCEEWGEENVINPANITVIHNITEQSPEIGLGVDNNGWGDQGIFYGYAEYGESCMMPRDHTLAKSLCHMLYTQAKYEGIGGLDIKTEIILDETLRIEKIIAAVPCRSDEEYEKVKDSILKWYDDVEMFYPFYPEIVLNGTGNYVMHGPIADCGVTGRKLAVDFYGGNGHIGGGSPWTKDGSKADLTLNLLARKLAIKYANEAGCSVSVSLACCIGQPKVNIFVKSECGDIIANTSKVCRPKDLIKEFELDKPIFTDICHFGLFGEYQKDRKWETV